LLKTQKALKRRHSVASIYATFLRKVLIVIVDNVAE
jgi:hypothetical protein